MLYVYVSEINNFCSYLQSSSFLFLLVCVCQWRTERGGVWGVQTPPPPEIPKALQNHAKLNPIVKTVKNC